METRQMYLVAHLSEEHAIERVEAIVCNGNNVVYISDHPRRELRQGIDIHESFEDARKASLRFIDTKLHRYAEFRQRVISSKES